MALILLAEDEPSTIDHVRSVLASQGWLVKTVKSRAQALRAASEFAPQLVLLNDQLLGVDDLVRTFSRRSGGPGVVLLSAKDESSTNGEDIEAILTKPIGTEELIETIKKKLSTAPDKKASAGPDTDVRIFSSEEIFGDLLDEILDEGDSKPTAEPGDKAAEAEAVEDVIGAEVGAPAEATPPKEIDLDDLMPAELEAIAGEETTSTEAAAAAGDADSMVDFSDLEELAKEAVPALVDAVEAQARQVGEPEEELDVAELLRQTAPTREPLGSAPVRAVDDPDDDLEAKLSDTLAGVLAASLGAAAEPASATRDANSGDADDVDSLLSRALGDLNLGKPRSKVEAAAPAPVADIEEAPPQDIVEEEEVATDEEPDEEPEASEPEVEDEARDEEIAEPAAEDKIEKAAAAPIEFGEYSLEERIGLGGMAEVWKARRRGVEGFEKRVAIKKILPQPAENQDFVDMFIDEAKLAAQLNHQNITHIYDLGKVEDDYFIAMEYVAGKNLRHLLDAGRKRDQQLPAGLALYIASRIADALDYAHRSKDFNNTELGLVHRDVSPHNVLISYDGEIKLCDFGIAKAVSKISTTQMGALKGKLQYMSPEQAWGRSIDQRSDIFSTGTLLFEMLTGEKLFTGDSELAVLEAVRECETPERVIQDPAIPSRVKGLLLKALAKETDDRYETAGELLGGLEELLSEFEPTPGQKELSSYVRDLIDLPGEAAQPSELEPEDVGGPDAETKAEDEPAEPAALLMEEPSAAPEGVELMDEAATEQKEEVEQEERRPAFLKWLSKLLPVLAVVAIGGYLIADRLNEAPVTQPTEGTATQRISESPAFRPEAVEASLPPESETGNAATVAENQPVETPLPAPVEQQTTPAPAPQNQQPDEPAVEVTPARATDGAAGDSEPIQAGANGPQARQDPEAGASDPELDRRVEEELQRVQELLSTPDFAADDRQGSAAPVAEIDGATQSAPPSQDIAATELGALFQDATSNSTGREEPADSADLEQSLDTEEPTTLASTGGGFEESTALTAEGGEPPEEAAPPVDPQVAASSPDLPIAPPAEESAATQPGDLVEPGPGVVEPVVLSFQPPAYSQVARRVGVTGTVRVAVLVDEDGRVLEARLVEGLRQKVGLDEETLEAARQATFRAATKDGVPVKIWHELAVQFQP